MSETTLTEAQVEQIAGYIQFKERAISALNHAIRNAEAPIYAQVLDQMLAIVVHDALPGAIDCNRYFPNLYQTAKPPEPEPKKEEEE